MSGDSKMSSYGFKKKKEEILYKLVRSIFMRFIKNEKFDILPINFRKGTKYFSKVLFPFLLEVHVHFWTSKKEKAIRSKKRSFS